MNGIYLASYKALHENHNIVYQDINGQRDIGGDMMDIDLSPYEAKKKSSLNSFPFSLVKNTPIVGEFSFFNVIAV